MFNSKTQIKQELESLREKAVARSLRDKYTAGSGSFLSPEEADAYLAKQRKLQDQPIVPPLSLTSSAEISDWYMVQRQRELEERKKREEAETYLRAYRGNGTVFVESTQQNRPQLNSVSKSWSIDGISSAPSHDSSNISMCNNKSKKLGVKSSPATETFESDDDDAESIVIFTTPRIIDQVETHDQYQIRKESFSIESVEVALSSAFSSEDAAPFPSIDDERTKTNGSRSSPTVPKNLGPMTRKLPFSLADLSEWYMIQRQRDLDERKKREEAEAYLRSYRPQWVEASGKDRKQNSLVKSPLSISTDSENMGISTADCGEKDVQDVKGGGPRLSPVLRMISQFLHDHFDDDEKNSISIPSLDEPLSETKHACHSEISTEENVECSSDMHNRFELHLAHGCHFCHQIAVALCVKGLTSLISVSYHPFPTNVASTANETIASDDESVPILNELTDSSLPMPSRHIPCLWDKKDNIIVSSEPITIIHKINSEFNDFAQFPVIDLCPLEHQMIIDDITNNLIYKGLLEGAISCGSAHSQEEYDAALGKSIFYVLL